MLSDKLKIYHRNILQFREDHDHRIKQVFTVALLGFIVFLFVSKISKTIEIGNAAQRRIEKVAQEVKVLEEENRNLKYNKSLHESDTEIEAQYRALENKKREGEKVYLISFPEKDQPKISATEETKAEVVSKKPNWSIWLVRLFN